MLVGDRVELRPIREADLPAFISAHHDVHSRGDFFPLGVLSETSIRRQFAETGFWGRDEGTLLVWHDDEIVGHIEFFAPVSYWDAFELSYQLYDERHSRPRLHDRGGSTPRRLSDRDEEAAPDPARHRSRQRGQHPHRRQVRVRPRGDGTRHVLQRRPQPRRAPVLAAPNRPAAMAPHRVTVGRVAVRAPAGGTLHPSAHPVPAGGVAITTDGPHSLRGSSCFRGRFAIESITLPSSPDGKANRE